MIPILFEHDETEFTSNGICRLPDCIYCKATEVLNGQFECSFSYPVTGRHYADITEDRIIYTTHDDSRIPQPFDIYKKSAPMNGVVTFYARHISYRLNKIILKPFTAETCITAIAGLKNNCINENPFEFITDKTGVQSFAIVHPVSVRYALGDSEGAILNVYGGEYEWDKFLVRHKDHRGRDTDVELRYGKNLQDIQYDSDSGNTGTAVVPFWYTEKDGLSMLEEGIVVASGREEVADDYKKALLLDLTHTLKERPSASELRSEALKFLQTAKLPQENITVKFYELWNSEEYEKYSQLQRLYLGDTAKVIYTDLGIDISVRVVKKVYDSLQEMYDSMELGQIRKSFGTEISASIKNLLTEYAPSKTDMQRAIDHATALIRGGLGGHVVIGVNADGQPNEILLMDTDNIETAVNVLRINMNGIGFSSTGYEGEFTTAWTLDGNFVADFITTGNLNASLLTAGIITDAQGNNSWNLETGHFITNDAEIGGIDVDSSGLSGPNFSINSGGTFSFGDATQYIQFVGREGDYRLEAKMESLTLKGTDTQGRTEYKSFDGDTLDNAAKTATNYLYWNDSTGLVMSETGTAEGTALKPYNTQILSDGINFRENTTILASITGTALTFYRGDTEKPGFSVGSDELAFFLPDGQTKAATVSADGLVVSKGEIGGIVIDEDSIHSSEHDSVTSESDGFYLGEDGRFSVGTGDNYIRLVNTPSAMSIDDMTLEIQVDVLKVKGTDSEGQEAYNALDGDAAKTATNYLYYTKTDGLVVSETGKAQGDNNHPLSTQIKSDGIYFKNKNTKLMSLDGDYIKFYRGRNERLGLQISESQISIHTGSTDAQRMVVDSDNLKFYKKDGTTEVASVGSDGLHVKTGVIGGFTCTESEFGAKYELNGSAAYFLIKKPRKNYTETVLEINRFEVDSAGNISTSGGVHLGSTTSNYLDIVSRQGIITSSSMYIGCVKTDSNNVIFDNVSSGTGETLVGVDWSQFSSGSVKLAHSTGSSKRYKNHVCDMTSEYARKILGITPIIFTYKDGYLMSGDECEGKEIPGFYAEDVEEHLPMGVFHKDGLTENWKPDRLIPPMLKLIQDQQEEIDNLKREISEIKAMLLKTA